MKTKTATSRLRRASSTDRVSVYFAGGVALVYAAGVVGVHRTIVARRRRQAELYPTLNWLDWDTLLQGTLPPADVVDREVPSPPEGGPAPAILKREPTHEVKLLEALVSGASVQTEAFHEAQFSGGEAKWLGHLAWLREEPQRVLEELSSTPAETPAHVYLREWLTLQHEVNPLNLELMSFGAKLRINHALRRFGEQPALYFIRARASSLLGFNKQVVDDLARAVYFSRQARFYLRAVTELRFIEEIRPALSRACREAAEAEE